MKKKLCAALGLVGLTLVASILAGCSSTPEFTSTLAAPSPARLGAGDSIGLDLQRTDRVIARYDPFHRVLASQWGE